MGQLFTVLFLELFSHSTVLFLELHVLGSCSLYFFLSNSVTSLIHEAVFFSFSVTALIHEAAFPELFSHSSFKEFSVTGSLPAVNHLTANLSITCLEHFCFNILRMLETIDKNIFSKLPTFIRLCSVSKRTFSLSDRFNLGRLGRSLGPSTLSFFAPDIPPTVSLLARFSLGWLTFDILKYKLFTT